MSSKGFGILGGVLVYAVVGFFAAEYVAAAAYFLINKSAPAGITADTWSTYWHWYSGDPVQRKRLQLAAACGVIIVFVVPAMVLNAVTQTRRSLHGDARFARSTEVRKAGLMGELGIIVGKFMGSYLMFGGQQFVLVAAPTRSGKGVAIVVPNLLNWSGSVVCTDIKLENFKLTSRYRASRGQRVFLFNPFAEDGRTHRWNPLAGIRENPNMRVGDALAIGQAFYPSDNPKDAFWSDQARNLFLGLALYLVETPSLPRTMGELLRQSSGKGMPLKDHLVAIMAARSNGDDALSEECLDALNRFCSTSENTLSSILATFNAPLTIFASPVVDAATSACDFDIASVRKELMSIYIGVPPNKLADSAVLVNVLFSQIINENTRELPQNNPSLKHQCLLLMDEATAPGKIGILAKSVGYIAGYNLRLLTIVQSVAQLESTYGKEDARTMITNHALQVLYPPREQRDANEYSEMLGFFTEKSTSTGISRPRSGFAGQGGSSSENISDQRRALLLPQELKELGQDKEIVIVENTKPILCEKARFFDDDAFVDRLKSVSPSLRALGRKTPTRDQLETAAFVRGELSADVPTIDVDLHKAKIEVRVRPLKPGEPIDLSKLVAGSIELPAIEGGDSPSPVQVQAVVDAFFGQLEWADPATGEIGRGVEALPNVAFGAAAAPPAAGGSIEPAAVDEVGPPADEPPEDYFEGPAESGPHLGAVAKSEPLDLSVLDA